MSISLHLLLLLPRCLQLVLARKQRLLPLNCLAVLRQQRGLMLPMHFLPLKHQVLPLDRVEDERLVDGFFAMLQLAGVLPQLACLLGNRLPGSRLLPPVELLIWLCMSGFWLSLRSTIGRCGYGVVPRLGLDAALLFLGISGINFRYFLLALVDTKP